MKLGSTLLLAILAAVPGLQAVAQSQPATAAADGGTSTALYQFPPVHEPRVIDAAEALRIHATHGSDLLVVNYWATWCGPCVEELPYFIELSKKYPEKKVRVVGYSQDFPRTIERALIPFIKDKEIPYANLVLVVDPNEYIDMVAPKWEGALPATMFYDRQGNKVGEFLRVVKKEELFAKVDELTKAAAE